jgi:hypothetical protein
MPKPLFRVTGKTRSYAAAGMSGLKSIRHFCLTCGSLLFGMPEVAPDAVSVYVGSLDDPSVFRPEAILFARDRPSWDGIVGGLPEFDTMPVPPTNAQ